MNDPFGSMQGFMTQFQQFASNPMQFMMSRNMNLPQGFQNDPREAVQQLMYSGKMTQAQFNQLRQMANQIELNPMFRSMMGGR